ncbi:MAG: ATP-binding cassette domain-containing protein [Defluviitaleaceae bacterium]|nr:ATP-binding cassette domain-containing protein [Defluviitaleaceae bacterium]
MIVNRLEINKGRVHLKNVNLNFSSNGIYIITGDNGIGKTTILEHLLFNHEDITSFCEGKAIISHKQDFFGYIPQDLPQTTTLVSDYISKGVNKYDVSLRQSLFKDLYLEEKLMSSKFSELSGGEQIKIAFVSILLKDVPYIFLDEPTNNLDDSSVKKLKEMILYYSSNRKMIIITHDSRLIFEKCSFIKVDSDKITQENNFSPDPTEIHKKTATTLYNPYKIISKKFTEWGFTFINLLLFALIFLSLFWDNHFLQANNNHYDLPAKGAIFLATGREDHQYESFNQQVMNELNIAIDSESEKNSVQIDDIIEISKLPGINHIIISDFLYWQELGYHFEYLHEDVFVVNPPEIMWSGYDFYHLMIWPELLQLGRFPNDGEREVTISRLLLELHFEFDEMQLENPLGEFIYVNDILHEIVGITYDNLAIISFHHYENHGFYTFDLASFEEFKNPIVEHKTRNDWWNTNALPGTFLMIDAESELELLETILQKHPYSEAFSHSFSQAFMTSTNREAVRTLYVRNLFVSATIISFSIVYHHFLYSLIQVDLIDFKNYFFETKQFNRAFIVFYSLFQLALFMLSAVALYFIFNLSRYIFPVFLLKSLSLILVQTLFFKKKINKPL